LKKYTVDRFEGEFAVLLLSSDESVQKDVPKDQLPNDVKEGDIIEVSFNVDGTVKEAMIKREETISRKEKAQSLLEKLKSKNKK